jgi:hypothetical protein
MEAEGRGMRYFVIVGAMIVSFFYFTLSSSSHVSIRIVDLTCK